MDQQILRALTLHGMETRVVDGELEVLDVYADRSEWVAAPGPLVECLDWLGY